MLSKIHRLTALQHHLLCHTYKPLSLSLSVSLPPSWQTLQNVGSDFFFPRNWQKSFKKMLSKNQKYKLKALVSKLSAAAVSDLSLLFHSETKTRAQDSGKDNRGNARIIYPLCCCLVYIPLQGMKTLLDEKRLIIIHSSGRSLAVSFL